MARRRSASRGASTLDYLALAGLIALAALVALHAFGDATKVKAECIARTVARLELGGSACDEEPADVAFARPGARLQRSTRGGDEGPSLWQGVSAGIGKVVACSNGSCLAGGDQCFVAGTPVWTAEGLRPIESIRAGDLVLSRDPETRIVDLRPVVRTFVTPEREVAQLSVIGDDGTSESIGVTPDHRIWIDGGGFRPVRDVEPGARGVAASGRPVRFAALATGSERVTVYNLEVAGFHTYFVGRSAAWVHNECAKVAPRVERADFSGASAIDVLGVLDWWQRLGDAERRQINDKLAALEKSRGSKRELLLKEAKEAIDQRRFGDPPEVMRLPRNWQRLKDDLDEDKKAEQDRWRDPGSRLALPLPSRAARFRTLEPDTAIPPLRDQMQKLTETLMGKSGLREEVRKDPSDFRVGQARQRFIKVLAEREFDVDTDLSVWSKPTGDKDDKLGNIYFRFRTPPTVEIWDPTPQRGARAADGSKFPRAPNVNGRPFRIPKGSAVAREIAELETKVLNGALGYQDFLTEMSKLAPKVREEAAAHAKERELMATTLKGTLNNDLLTQPDTAEALRQEVRKGKNLRRDDDYQARSFGGKIGAAFQSAGNAADEALEQAGYLLNPLRWTFGTPNTNEKPIWERDFSKIPEAIEALPKAIKEAIEDASYEPDKLAGRIGFEVATLYLPTKASKLITVGDRALEAVNAVRQAKALAQAGKIGEAQEMLAIARLAQKDLVDLGAKSGKKAPGNIARGLDDGLEAAEKAIAAAKAARTGEVNEALRDLARLLDKSEAEVLADLEKTVGKSTQRALDRDTVRKALRGDGAKFPTHILDSVLDDNIAAVRTLRETLKELAPDAIVGMESGGAFLAEVAAKGEAGLAGKLVRVAKPPNEFRLPLGGKVDPAKANPAKTLKLLDDTVVGGTIPKLDTVALHNMIREGKKKIVIVDSYMGGSSRDNFLKMLKPLAEKHPGVKFELVWVRESFGLEQASSAGKVAMKAPTAGVAGVGERFVPLKYILGDDMNTILPGKTRDALKIFDNSGRIVGTVTPLAGESTRDALIRLLNAGTLGRAPAKGSPAKAAAALEGARLGAEAATKRSGDGSGTRRP